MKALVGSLLLGLGLIGTPMLQAQQVVLRAAAQEGSAPKFIDGNGAPSGHCPDILQAIERADRGLQFAISARPTPIKRIEVEIRERSLDVMCALLDTPLRNELAHRINPPIYLVHERLVGRKDDDASITSIADLVTAGANVVTQSGASYADDLRAKGVRVIETPGGSAIALRNVQNRRVRFYYTNELTGAYYIHTENMEADLRLHPGVMQSSPSYLWVGRHVDGTVVQRLEAAVALLKRNGELDRIYQRYQRTP